MKATLGSGVTGRYQAFPHSTPWKFPPGHIGALPPGERTCAGPALALLMSGDGAARRQSGGNHGRRARHRRRDRAALRGRGRARHLRRAHAARRRPSDGGLARDDGDGHSGRRRRGARGRCEHRRAGRVRAAHRRCARSLRSGRRARQQRRAHLLSAHEGLSLEPVAALVGGELPRPVRPEPAGARRHDRAALRRDRQHLVGRRDRSRTRTLPGSLGRYARRHLLRRREGGARALHPGTGVGGVPARRVGDVCLTFADRSDARHRPPPPREESRRSAWRGADPHGESRALARNGAGRESLRPGNLQPADPQGVRLDHRRTWPRRRIARQRVLGDLGEKVPAGVPRRRRVSETAFRACGPRPGSATEAERPAPRRLDRRDRFRRAELVLRCHVATSRIVRVVLAVAHLSHGPRVLWSATAKASGFVDRASPVGLLSSHTPGRFTAAGTSRRARCRWSRGWVGPRPPRRASIIGGRMDWQKELDELRRREELADQLGGPERIKRQHDGGRLTILERIARLLDKGSFHEIGKIAGRAEYDAKNDLVAFTPSNFVFGRGEIDGRPVVVGGDDFTVRGGSADATIRGKHNQCERMAHDLRLPLMRLVEGSGGGGSVKTIETTGRANVPGVDGWEWVVNNMGTIPRKRYKMRRIVESVVDQGSFFEVAALYGRSVITGYARLDGWPVALMASDPYFYGGAWPADTCQKVERFIDIAQTFHLPVVYLVDCPGFLIGLDAEKTGTIKQGVRAMSAMWQATIPWCAVIVRNSFGVAGAAHRNQSRHCMRYAWPSGRWGSLPLEGGIEAAYRADLDA